MLKIKNINLNNIKISFNISPKILADKAFLIFLGFLSIALIIGTVIFYKYTNLIKESSSTSKESPQFNEKAYNNILTVWQTKEEKLKAIDSKKYQDPFNLIPQKLTK